MTVRRYINDIILNTPISEASFLNYLPVVEYLKKNKKISLSSNITFFVGENGIGKSTLLEAIAVAYGFNPEGGTKNFDFSTEQTHSELWEHLILSRGKYAKDGFFLRAESLYNVATNIDDMDKQPAACAHIIDAYGGVSLHKQSHGESFLAIVQNRLRGRGLYIFDEPESALSPMKLMTLMVEMNNLVKKDSQFIIATHSPILMTFPGAEILEFSKEGIRSVDYRDTEHYQITRRFLENPDRMLRYLFE